MKYLKSVPTSRSTPQSQPIPGKTMVQNNAGGYVFEADKWARMLRFLILGSEGSTYYVDEKDLTQQNVGNVYACIKEDGLKAVDLIVDVSKEGRAPKNDPALYALALAASCDDEKTRSYALRSLQTVARIGTHLFAFCEFVNKMRGWGPALRRAVASWYTDKPEGKLAYQLVKYQNRNGWSHRDAMRLAHPKPAIGKTALMKWAAKGERTEDVRLPDIVEAFEEAKTASESRVCELIGLHGLTHEMVPTQFLKSASIWEALLKDMPMTAMVRSLGRMGACGLLAPFSSASKTVCQRLGDGELLRGARVHPIQLLNALLTYKSGHGLKGGLSWNAVPQVVDALDAAFYESFKHVEPSGKRFYVGIDVSGSMAWSSHMVAGSPLMTPNMGAAAMAMLIARTEQDYYIGGFSTRFVNLGITSKDTLDSAMKKAQRDFGGTDCAVAINDAIAKHYSNIDAFVVITDGETWAGDEHACQSIKKYRNMFEHNAKLIVINMVANMTKITDGSDAGSLDVVGFDANVPEIINRLFGSEC